MQLRVLRPDFAALRLLLGRNRELSWQAGDQSINQSSIFQDYYKRYIQVIVKSQWLIVAVVIQGQT